MSDLINGYKWLDQWLQVTWSMVTSDLSNGYAIQTHSSMWIATFSNMNIMQKYIDTIREVTIILTHTRVLRLPLE